MNNTREGSRAFILYLLLIALMYSPVVFGGKSLLPTVVQPGGLTGGLPYGYEGRTPVNTFNVDLPTPAYYELPVNRTVGNIYARGELPLWNPHQAAGTPLVADYSTRAFFPYQVLLDLSPVGTWDLLYLVRLLVAGFFTYLFLACTGLSFTPAFAGGVFFMFSGAFTWFINLEQFANVAMTLPVLMYTVERLLRRQDARSTGFAGVCFALVLLAGQPEVALYVLFLAASYATYRAVSLYLGAPRRILSAGVRLLAAFIVGMLLAAPLVLPFLKYVEVSHNMHAPGSGVGVEYVKNWRKALTILTPGAAEVPADPSLLPGALAETKDAAGQSYYHRVFATKGMWDYLGGYTGTLPIFLALTGLALSVRSRQPGVTGPLVFFFAFGLALVLKNFGLKPFLWLGYLPFFDQAWGPRWSGPAWVFPFAAAGAMGLQAVKNKGDALKGGISTAAFGLKAWRAPVAAFAIVAGGLTLLALPMVVRLVANKEALFGPGVVQYIFPAIALSHLVVFAVLAAAAVVSLLVLSNRAAAYSLVAIAVVELWWAVPRGYDHLFMGYKLLPFAIGLLGAVLFASRRHWRAAAAVFCAFLITSFGLDLASPRGLPERHDPFAEPPYVEFLRDRPGDFRVMGGYGVLAPNFAGSVGLHDLRYINALVLPAYHGFRAKHLQLAVENEDVISASLWFTGMPQRIIFDYKEDVGYYFRHIELGVEEEIGEKLPYYSLMGVRYFLMPSGRYRGWGEGLGMKLVYGDEVDIFENPDVLPRAFVAFPFNDEKAFRTARESVRATGAGSFELDEPVLRNVASRGVFEEATIVEYGANRVTVQADTERPGVLVLSDVLAPGWGVKVNGRAEPVFPVNGHIRGVLVEAGQSTVEFRYSPPGFRTGICLFALGVLLTAGAIVPRKKRP